MGSGLPLGHPKYKTEKPEPIANLGDVDFLTYGGRLVYPGLEEGDEHFMEVIFAPPESEELTGDSRWMVYRFDLERFKTVTKSGRIYLVNRGWDESWLCPLYEYDEWFNQELGLVAVSVGSTEEELREAFTSEDVLKRAWAWCCIGDYWGFDELDSYPLTLTQHEAYLRYGLRGDCDCERCEAEGVRELVAREQLEKLESR